MYRMICGSALAAGLGFSNLSSSAATPTFELFTQSEAILWNSNNPDLKQRYGTRELREPGVPSCHDIPAAAAQSAMNPQIKIVAPLLDKPLAAPLDIDLLFVPTPSAAIKPDTFRVCYVGFLTMDITKRITDHVTISPQGLHVAGAQLPHGHHHLVMMIADQQGQIGSREAIFDIQ
jgi:hypothetical protein